MAGPNLKKTAHELIDQLSENVTWDDVVRKMVTRQEIELDLADGDANRTTPVENAIKEFGFDAGRSTGRKENRGCGWLG